MVKSNMPGMLWVLLLRHCHLAGTRKSAFSVAVPTLGMIAPAEIFLNSNLSHLLEGIKDLVIFPIGIGSGSGMILDDFFG